MVYHLGQHECVLPGHDHSRLAQNKSFLILFGARAVCFLLRIPTLLYRWRNWDEEWPCLLLIIWFTKPILAVGGRPTTVQSSPTPCSCPSLCSCCIPLTEELKHWFPLGMERRTNQGRRSQELLPHYQRGTGSPWRPCDSSSTHVSCVMEMIRLWSVMWVIVGRGNGSFAHLSHTQRVVCVPVCAQVHRYVGAEGTLRCCSSGQKTWKITTEVTLTHSTAISALCGA